MKYECCGTKGQQGCNTVIRRKKAMDKYIDKLIANWK
jgi:hypothetical protein